MLYRCIRHLQPAILGLQLVECRRAEPMLAAHFRRRKPASCSLIIPMICSSEKRLFLIHLLLRWGRRYIRSREPAGGGSIAYRFWHLGGGVHLPIPQVVGHQLISRFRCPRPLQELRHVMVSHQRVMAFIRKGTMASKQPRCRCGETVRHPLTVEESASPARYAEANFPNPKRESGNPTRGLEASQPIRIRAIAERPKNTFSAKTVPRLESRTWRVH